MEGGCCLRLVIPAVLASRSGWMLDPDMFPEADGPLLFPDPVADVALPYGIGQ